MAVNEKLMTADDLAQLPRGRARHALIRGVLHTMPLAFFDEAHIVSEASRSLSRYASDHRLGEVFVGAGFQLTVDPDTVRGPDVALLRRERLSKTGIPSGYYPGAPDLVIEVVSPSDLYLDVCDAIADWLEHGTQIVFVVNPRRRTVAVHRPGQPIQRLGMEDVLSAEDVVPGWSLAVSDLFDQS